jgi:hypothetical protein
MYKTGFLNSIFDLLIRDVSDLADEQYSHFV